MPQTDTSPTLEATQRAIALVELLPADKLTLTSGRSQPNPQSIASIKSH
jgi:hypothetical protein